MSDAPEHQRPGGHPRHSRTIRLRLTLIYGGVFLVTGVMTLVIGIILVRHNINNHAQSLAQAEQTLTAQFNHFYVKHHRHLIPKHPLHPRAFYRDRFRDDLIKTLTPIAYHTAGNNTLRKLVRECVAALFGMILVSAAIGWVIAGRALGPLREITATARRVSGENLGERIDLQGPSDELKELADTFDAMLARLDQTFASQRHFVANASHELRTPLAIMRTEIDVALADPDASVEELRLMGEGVRETIDRGEALVAALLQLARSEAITGREELVDVSQIAGDVITDLSSRATAAAVHVVTDLHPAVAFGESALLERVLTNLIDNAIRHNRRDGCIWVTTRTRSGAPMVQIIVRNDGQPIDPVDVPSLTEPFRRLTRTAGGFGLGLSIVKSVAEAHGGSVELHARPEGGLEVKVELPAAARFQAAALTQAHSEH